MVCVVSIAVFLYKRYQSSNPEYERLLGGSVPWRNSTVFQVDGSEIIIGPRIGKGRSANDTDSVLTGAATEKYSELNGEELM